MFWQTMRARNRKSLLIIAGVIAVGTAIGMSASIAASPTVPSTPTPDVITQLQSVAARLGDYNMSVGATPPNSAEVVETTYAEALSFTSGDILPASAPNPPVYVVQLRGSFTGYMAKIPLGAATPTGAAATFIFDPASGQANDWGFEKAPLDLSTLGSVSQFPVTITPIGGGSPSPSPTPSAGT